MMRRLMATLPIDDDDTLTPADLIPHNNAVDADEDADIDDHH